MSWGITLNGHLDNQDEEKLEALAKKIGQLAKKADVGLTYLSFYGGRGPRSLFQSSINQDDLDEAAEEAAESEDKQ